MPNAEANTLPDKTFALMTTAGAVLVAIMGSLTRPRTFWEFDELLFAWGVLDFDPKLHHPHPPGFPLLIGLGKAINVIADDPFNALVFLSFLSTVLSFVAVCYLFRNLLGSTMASFLGALLFALCPAMLMTGVLPMSDPPALMFLTLALALGSSFPERLTNRRAVFFGILCAAAIGCRPQFAVPVVPMFLYTLIRNRDWHRARISLVSFTITCLAWLLPLIDAVGGVRAFDTFESRQAAYVAAHDASMSRGAHSPGELILRFVAHPWGTKWLALPVLSLAVIGAIVLVRKRAERTIPLFLVTLVQIVFCLLSMDPADGVRYALPSLIGVALAAAAGFDSLSDALQFRMAPSVFVALFAIGSFLYARPIIRTRDLLASPPVQAVAWARSHLPSDAVVLYEVSLRPHAEFLLGRFHPIPLERGLQRFANRPDVPLFALVDGGSAQRDAVQFSWPYCDAYGKLTRDHYRVVSIVPLPMSRRYTVVRGVYPFERTTGGKEWRWLDQRAQIVLADGAGQHVALGFYLPPDAPAESARVSIRTSAGTGQVIVPRGGSARTTLSIPSGPVTLDFESSSAYVPAAAVGNRDPRHLSVQLVSIERQP